MKKIAFLLSFIFLLSLPVTAYASNGEPSGVAITVVIPQNEAAREAKPPQSAASAVNYLYPISVNEQRENGQRIIVKTYELGAGEKPGDISRESFVRDGWLYEITDIIRKESATMDGKEIVENVTLDSTTNDTEAILRLFSQTIEYTSEDGFYGVLTLDISSIKVETAGTRQESFTANITREYPHLSSNDSSLVPKTVTDSGREYTLVGVDWRAQNSTTIDYVQIAESYTAVAKYTRTGYRNVTTGYVATADYKGNVAKIISGKTLYTAYFYGVQIVTPLLNTTSNTTTNITPEVTVEPIIIPEATPVPVVEPEPIEVDLDMDAAEEITETIEQLVSPVLPDDTEEPQDTEPPKAINPFLLLGLVILGVAMGGGFVFLLLRDKKKEGEPNEEIS